MTVENNDKRKDVSHGLRAPHAVGSEEFLEWLQDMLELVELAKERMPSALMRNEQVRNNWEEVRVIINKHSPVQIGEVIREVMLKFGFETWAECVEFVRDDECIEFMVRIAHYAKRRKVLVRKDRGFIDGEGVGLYARWAERTDRTLEKTFDAKYHFRQIRPLEYLNQLTEIDHACTMNYVHPGHYAYPAGHGAKFFETLDLARDTWELSEEQDGEILTASIVLAMARSWWGVHYPEDNLASGYFAGLKEFSSYKA